MTVVPSPPPPPSSKSPRGGLYHSSKHCKLYQGDAVTVLRDHIAANSIDMVMCSPPYYSQRFYQTEPIIWDGDLTSCSHEFIKRQYKLHAGRGDAQKSAKYSEQAHIPDTPMSDATCRKCGAWKGELGLEPSVELYIKHLADIFDEVKRVLKPTGTCWIVIGDKYNGSGGAGGDYNPGGIREDQPRYGRIAVATIPFKSIFFAPYRLGIEMTNRGWVARQIIIWHKPNRMPENVVDRYTTDWEPVLLFSKTGKYYFNKENNGRRRRSVWSIPTEGYGDEHYAAYPPDLCRTPIEASCPEDGTVLDPFCGTGATGEATLSLARDFVGIDINQKFCELALKRLDKYIIQERLL
jgi:site-specific DNA-methyltransferase (cytosine-N4-specific)